VRNGDGFPPVGSRRFHYRQGWEAFTTTADNASDFSVLARVAQIEIL
jgi:hypothetical protein